MKTDKEFQRVSGRQQSLLLIIGAVWAAGLLLWAEALPAQCTNPSITLPDASQPVNGNPANAYCVTLSFDPAVTGFPTGISMMLQHTWQGDLDIFVNACGNTLVVMQRPGVIGSCSGGCPCGNAADIGSPGSPVLVSFSDGGGPDPEAGIATAGGSYGVTTDDACDVGTPGIASFASLWAGCPAGVITTQVCIGDHAFGDSGVAQNISLTFPSAIVCGCTDPEASNYNPNANVDDGSCIACVLTANANAAPAGCGQNNGSISVQPSGPGYTYTWSNPSITGSNPTGLAPGTYTVTVTQISTGCDDEVTVTVGAPPPLDVTSTQVQPSCGLNNGSIQLSVSGSGYTYSWSPATVSGSNPTGLAAGTYTVTVTATATGCSDVVSVILSPGSPLEVTTNVTNTSCGLNNGAISLSPAGPDYTYVWSPATYSGSQLSNLAAGTYSVTVTQLSTGCSTAVNAVVNSSDVFVAEAAVTQPSCGLNNGAIAITPADASAYSYTWGNPALSGTNPTNLAPGLYTLTVTNLAGGCSDTLQISLSGSNPLSVSAQAFPGVVCPGQSTQLTASGGSSYVWNNGQTGESISVTLGSTTTFSVTATDGVCSGTATVTVTVTQVSPTITASPAQICEGGTSVLTASGGSSYVWSTGATTSSISVSPAETTVYTVTVTSLSCSAEASAEVAVVSINPAISPANPVACAGSSLELTATGGTGYLWSTGQTTNVISVSPSSTTTYTVTVSESGCSETVSTTVEFISVSPGASASPATICVGESSTLTASGGSAYSWSNGQTGESIQVMPDQTTTYTVTVTENGCTATTSVTVVVNNPTASISSNFSQLCVGQTAVLTGMGGGSYAWSTGQTGAVISVAPTETTVYELTVTVAGCQATTVLELPVVQVEGAISASANPVCVGDVAELSASGGTSFQWSTGQTSSDIVVSPLLPTVYSVTVTLDGCTDVEQLFVDVISLLPSVTADPPQVCEGESTVLTASGGLEYLWNTGETDESIVVSPDEMTAYSVTVTDSGCSESVAIVVDVIETYAVLEASPPEICLGAETSLTASGGDSFTWSTGQTGPSITVSPLFTTEYAVTVENAGCPDVASVIVTVNEVVASIDASSMQLCVGESAILWGTGGSLFEWSTGETSPSISVTPATTTTYELTVTDAGCEATASVTIVVEHIVAEAVALPEVICPGLSAVLTASGGSGYFWSTGQTGDIIEVSPETTTTYAVTVTEGNCAAETTVTVVVGNYLQPDVIASEYTVCPGEAAVLTASGGTTYLWSTGETGSSIEVAPLTSTSYTVTVTNEGCTGVGEILIEVDQNLPLSIIANDDELCAGESTVLTVVGGVEYVWSTGEQTASIVVSPGESTNYSVTATENGCVGEAQVLIEILPLPTALAIAAPEQICAGGSTQLMASGGSQYQWSTGQTSAVFTVSPPQTTTYTVTVTDNGCVSEASLTVWVTPLPTVAISASETQICAGESVVLTASGTGDYQWSTGESGVSSIVVSPLNSTVYWLSVTEEGCVTSESVEIFVGSATVQLQSSASQLCLGESVVLSAVGQGSVVWSTGETAPTIELQPLQTTTYSLTITNGLCQATDSVEVAVINPVVQINSSNLVICPGVPVQLMAVGIGEFLWNTGDTSSALEVAPLVTTTYTVEANQSGCVAMDSLTIVVSSSLLPVITASADTICPGGVATLQVEGGTAYLWSNGATTASVTVSPAESTTYSVSVSNGSCQGEASYPLTVAAVPVPIVNYPSVPLCAGDSLTLNASGGSQYRWSTGVESETITVLLTENAFFAVTVTNSQGCEASADVQLPVQAVPVPLITAMPASICFGESTTLTAGGGESYLWSNGQSVAQINVSPLQTATYRVIVGAGGCSAADSVTVIVRPLPEIEAQPDTICAGATALLSAAGGAYYTWSTGEEGSSITVSPQETTSYGLTVTDEGCQTTGSVVVTVLPLPQPVITAMPPVICRGDMSILTASGSETWLWSTGAATATIEQQPVVTTTYTVRATSADGCSATAAVELVVNEPPTLALVDTLSICNGAGGETSISFGQAVLSGSSSGYWLDTDQSGASGLFPELDFTGVAPGSYRFVYTTDDALPPCENITDTLRVTVRSCSCPAVDILPLPAICQLAGVLPLSQYVPEGALGYWIVSEVPVGQQPVYIQGDTLYAQAADSGRYALTFFLQDPPPPGCPNSSVQYLQVDAAADSGLPAASPHICFGQGTSIDLESLLVGAQTGGSWQDLSIPSAVGAFVPSTGTLTTAALEVGTYTFAYELDPGNSCPVASSRVSVIIEPLPYVAAGEDAYTDCFITAVDLEGEVGGAGALQYRWYTNGGMPVGEPNQLRLSQVPSGTYVLEVIASAYGCRATDTVLVTAREDSPSLTGLQYFPPRCNGDTNGRIDVGAASGGLPPYLFAFNGGALSGQSSWQGLAAGSYVIYVEDSRGCSATTSVELVDPPLLSVTTGVDIQLYVGDTIALAAAVSPTGADYTYRWTPARGLSCTDCPAPLAFPTETTLYTLEVRNAKGCKESDQIRLFVKPDRAIYFPTGFSPNGDQINDVWMIYGGLGVELVEELHIFNRWGESVYDIFDFQTDNPVYGWDGRQRGQPAPPAVYAFYALVRYKDGKRIVHKGEITLLR